MPPDTPILTPYFKETLEGSFSAVSTLLIARVGAFFSIFRDLQSPLSGRKKSASTFLPPEKKEHLEDWGAPRGLGGYQRQKWGNAHVERESPQKFNAQKDSQSALVNLG